MCISMEAYCNLHVSTCYAFVCVLVCTDAWLNLICLRSAHDTGWRGGPLDYLSSETSNTQNVAAALWLRQKYTGGHKEVQDEISQQITPGPIYGPQIERFARKMHRRRYVEMTGLLIHFHASHTNTHLHTHTHTCRHIIHTAWAAMPVNSSSLYLNSTMWVKKERGGGTQNRTWTSFFTITHSC